MNNKQIHLRNIGIIYTWVLKLDGDIEIIEEDNEGILFWLLGSNGENFINLFFSCQTQ